MALIINPEDTFKQRKQQRTDYFEQFIKGWRQSNCTACDGSGFYDHDGNPDCDACSGEGKESYQTDLNALYPIVGKTFQYNGTHGDSRLPEGVAIRVYIKNTRDVRFQYVDNSRNGKFKTVRTRAKLSYLYNHKTSQMEWAFIDEVSTPYNKEGSIFFIQEFEPDTTLS